MTTPANINELVAAFDNFTVVFPPFQETRRGRNRFFNSQATVTLSGIEVTFEASIQRNSGTVIAYFDRPPGIPNLSRSPRGNLPRSTYAVKTGDGEWGAENNLLLNGTVNRATQDFNFAPRWNYTFTGFEEWGNALLRGSTFQPTVSIRWTRGTGSPEPEPEPDPEPDPEGDGSRDVFNLRFVRPVFTIPFTRTVFDRRLDEGRLIWDLPFSQPPELIPSIPADRAELRLTVDWGGLLDGNLARLKPDTPDTLADLGEGLRRDVSPDLWSVTGTLGRAPDSLLEGVDEGGSLIATLNNAGGRYALDRWTVHHAARTEPKLGNLVILWASTPGDDWIPVWGGHFREIRPTWSKNSYYSATLEALGPLAYIGKRAWRIFLSPDEFRTIAPPSGEMIERLLAVRQQGEPVYPADRTVVAPGAQRLRPERLSQIVGGVNSLVPPLQPIQQIAKAEGGYVYGSRDARVISEDRKTRALRYAAGRPVLRVPDAGIMVIEETGALGQLFNEFVPEGYVYTSEQAFEQVLNGRGSPGYDPPTTSPYRTAFPIFQGLALTIEVLPSAWLRADETLSAGGKVFWAAYNLRGVRNDGAVRARVLQHWPTLQVEFSIPFEGIYGTSAPHHVYIYGYTARGRLIGSDDVRIFSINRASQGEHGVRTYEFPGKLMDTSDRASLINGQAFVAWQARHFGRKWRTFRARAKVTKRNEGLLGYSIGDMLDIQAADVFPELTPIVLERVRIQQVQGKAIDLTWDCAAAEPYADPVLLQGGEAIPLPVDYP